MMHAIEAQKQRHFNEQSPRSQDHPENKMTVEKIDPKNISGGPFMEAPKSDY